MNFKYSSFSLCLIAWKRYYCGRLFELENDVGNIIRIENLAKNSISAKVENLSNNLIKAKADLVEAKTNEHKPFEHSEELKQKTDRVAFINSELSFDKAEDVYINEDGDNEKQKSLIEAPVYKEVSQEDYEKLKELGINIEGKPQPNGKIIIKFDKSDERGGEQATNKSYENL